MNIKLYIRIMQNIKERMAYVNSIHSSAESMRMVSVFMVETICLQLRLTIEEIAVACIIANADDMPKVVSKLKKAYKPKRILERLESINPEYYPIPMVENVEGSHGRFRDTYDRPEGDWLTREEAIEVHGTLNDSLHQTLKKFIDHPINIRESYEFTTEISTKIINLLSHHQISVIDENKMYRVLMQSSDDGEIHLAEFQRIDELPDNVVEIDATG